MAVAKVKEKSVKNKRVRKKRVTNKTTKKKCIRCIKKCECFQGSYAFQIFIEEGHEWDYNKNKDINPRDISNTEQKEKYHFICRTCKHRLNIPPDAAKRGACQICNASKVCGEDNCKDCFDKSYASAPIGSLVLYEQARFSIVPRVCM